jgi:hypothetical protein
VQGCLLGGDLGGLPAPENPDVRIPGPAAEPRRPPAPKPHHSPPARVPVPAALRSLVAMAAGPVALVAGAVADARAAVMKAEPEPVLGAP